MKSMQSATSGTSCNRCATTTFMISLLMILNSANAFRPTHIRILQKIPRLNAFDNSNHGECVGVSSTLSRKFLSSFIALGVFNGGASSMQLINSHLSIPLFTTVAHADDDSSATAPTISAADKAKAPIKKQPLLTARSSDTIAYTDIPRGFKLLRPFGFNEFEGSGAGYAVKFASLYDVDENVVVGTSAASSGKESIVDYGSLEEIGQKLLKKREGATLVKATARETEGIVFYSFEFDTQLDPSLPRPGSKNNKPTRGVELYQLCVNRGKLWSVQATSNDKLFPNHEKTLKTALYSFMPRL